MKIDCGFFDKDGEYKEDIQEVEMLSVKDLNEIELIKGQNEGLRKQNAELQKQIKKYAKINEQETKDYAELKAENERLKALLDVLEEDNKKLSKENDVFYNNSLQAVKEDLVQRVWSLQKQYTEIVSQFEIESLTDDTTGETIYRSRLVNNLQEVSASFANSSEAFRNKANEYKSCLQEIKAIVKNICDGCTSECDCDEDCNYFLITEQLTKAEEE